jgi:hypothetical protein
VLWARVRDTSIPLPSRQEIEAVWERYLRGTSPTRDEELKAYLAHWGIVSGFETLAPAHDMAGLRR